MPALVSHWLLGKRVLPLLKKREDMAQLDETCFLWGCQGPDVLFFLRLMPWMKGPKMRETGSRIHDDSPSKLFTSIVGLLDRCGGEYYNKILSYALGVCCHYCFDRTAHPYVNWLEKQMKKSDPRGGKFSYHGEIESMLDVMLLRHDTGRLLLDMKLTDCLPEGSGIRDVLAMVWSRVLIDMYGMRLEDKYADLLYSDTLQCFRVLDNRSTIRLPIFRAAERLFGKNTGMVSAYMRPLTESLRWDYGNMNHGRWVNPMDAAQSGTEDIYQLADIAERDCGGMFDAFLRILRRPEGERDDGTAEGRTARVLREFMEYTEERSFSYNVNTANC
ncbi:MAG: hypothetical protein E7559_00010 [Ruminococcaceae bacterium]|nr:hypothetical protein [Oscillospiraceae bacterium]